MTTKHMPPRKRPRNNGARGVCSYIDRWKWLAKDNDYLFPATRRDSKEVHQCKDTVWKTIARLRQNFLPPKNHNVHTDTIRSHSGRHRMVNDLKSSGIPDDVATSFARICDKRTFAGYGQLTNEQTGASLEKNKALKRTMAETYKLSNKQKKGK